MIFENDPEIHSDFENETALHHAVFANCEIAVKI